MVTIVKICLFLIVFCIDGLLVISGNLIFKGDITSFVVGIILLVISLSMHINFIKDMIKE